MIMEREPKIGIVLVNYNGIKFQNDTIRSIVNLSYHNYEVVVVDNASTDNSIKLLKDEFPWVTIIDAGKNLGVAAGNNIGIKYAIKNGAEYVLLLNNDVELDKELLTHMIENAREDIITVPKIYYFDRKKIIWSAGAKIDWDTATPYHLGYNQTDGLKFNKKAIIECAPTCCMLIHKNVFKKVGFMDCKYFMYYDDTDFCIRADQCGYKIMFVPEAIMWHKVHSSSGGSEFSKISVYYLSRNRLYLMHKNKDKLGKHAYQKTGKILWDSIIGYSKKRYSKYVWIGYLDYFLSHMYRKDFK